MRKSLLLFFMLLLGATGAFAQAPTNDACSTPKTLCYQSGIALERNNNALSNDGNYPAGGLNGTGAINKGIWYTFTAYLGGHASVLISGISGATNLHLAAQVYSGTCGSLTPVLPIAGSPTNGSNNNNSGGTSFTVDLANVTAGVTYYIVVGVVSPVNPANSTFTINIDNITTGAIIGKPAAGIGAFPSINYVCANGSDSLFTFKNNTTYNGGNVKYQISFGNGFKNYSGNDTTVNIIKFANTGNKDSVDITIRAINDCGNPPIPSLANYRIYVQKLEAKFDTLPHAQCGQDSVAFKVIQPFRPPVFPKDDGNRDTAYISQYHWIIKSPCGTLDTIVAGGTSNTAIFKYKPHCSIYSDYDLVASVELTGDCGPAFAYNAKGDFITNQPDAVKEDTIRFTIFAPPQVRPVYSDPTSAGVFSSKKDTVCAGADMTLQLPRYSKRGHGTFTYTVTTRAGSAGTVTGPTDSTFVIKNLPKPSGTTFLTEYYDIHVHDSYGCDGDTFAVVVVRPKVLVDAFIEGDTEAAGQCNSGDFNLTGTILSGSGPFTYNWTSIPAGKIASQDPLTGIAKTTILTDTATLFLSVTDKYGCISAQDSVQALIYASPKLAPTITGSDSVCVGNNNTVIINANASGGTGIYPSYTYIPSPSGSITGVQSNGGATSTESNVRGATKFIITVTDQYTCVGKDSISVKNAKKPTLTVTKPSNTCQRTPGKTATFAISNVSKFGGTPTFTWTGIPAGFSPSTTTAQSQTFTIGSNVAAGTYPISIAIGFPVGSNVCDTVVSDSITISASPYAKVAFTPANDTVCIGQNIHIVASDATDLTNANVYKFGANPPRSTFDSVYTASNPPNIALHVDRGGCTQDTLIKVVVLPNPLTPQVSPINLVVCDDAPFSYSIINPVAKSTYTWTFTPIAGSATPPTPFSGPGTVFSGNLGKAIDKNTPATYTVSVFETNYNGCVGPKYISGTITVNPKPQTDSLDGSLGSNFNYNKVCPGDVRMYKVPHANPASTFKWFLYPAAGVGTLNASTGNPISITWLPTTTVKHAVLKVVETRSTATCEGDTAYLQITENPLPVITAASTNPTSFCEDSIYTVGVNAYNGVFKWTLDPIGASNITITGDSLFQIKAKTITSVPAPPNNTATFTVNLKDSVTGCIAVPITIGPLTIYKQPNVVINKVALASHTVCQGSSVNFTASVTPVAPNPVPVITWSKAALTASDRVTGTISSSLPTATYNVGANDSGDVVITINASNQACRNGVDTVILHVLTKPRVNIVRTTTVPKCQGDTVSLNDVTTNYPDSVKWTVANAGSGSYTGTFTPSAKVLHPVYVSNPLENGNTTLTITVSNGACGNVTDAIIVPYSIKPVAKIIPVLSQRRLCAGDPPTIVAQRSGSQGTSYWRIISGVGTITQPAQGVLSLTYNPPSNLSGAPVKVVIGLRMQNAPCDSSTDTTSFYVIPRPAVVITSPVTGKSYCLDMGYPVGLNSSVTNTTSGSVYAWSAKDPGGVTVNPASPRFANTNQPSTVYNTKVTDAPGAYTIRLTVTEMGCFDFDQITINLVKPATADIPVTDPVISAPNSPVLPSNQFTHVYTRCQGDTSISFTHTIFTPANPTLINWSAYTNGVNTSNQFNSNISPNPIYQFSALDVGITKIYLKVLNAPCDTARDSIIVMTTPTPQANSILVGVPNPTKPICFGTNVPLDVNLAPGTLPAYQYSWGVSVVTGTWNPPVPQVKNPTYIRPTASTTFVVTVTDGNCRKVLSQPITIVNADKIHVADTAYCVNNPIDIRKVDIDAYSSTGTGKWSTPTDPTGSQFIPNNTATTGNISYKPNDTDTLNKGVKIIFTSDEPNCVNKLADTVNVHIRLSSVLHVNPLPKNTVHQGEAFEMPLAKVTGSDNQPGIQGSAYWKSDGTGKFTDGNGNVDNINPRYYIPSDADYLAGTIKLTYSLNADDNCNQGSVTREITVEIVSVPTVFTPDGDGVNDNFDLSGLPEHLHLKIFDRWGKLVYEKEDYDNSWDAKDVSAGTFYYVATYKLGSKHGWVQVFKK